MIFKREIPRSEARSNLRCIAFPTPRSHRDVESREKLYAVFVLRSRAKISGTLVEIYVSVGYRESTPSPQMAIIRPGGETLGRSRAGNVRQRLLLAIAPACTSFHGCRAVTPKSPF